MIGSLKEDISRHTVMMERMNAPKPKRNYTLKKKKEEKASAEQASAEQASAEEAYDEFRGYTSEDFD